MKPAIQIVHWPWEDTPACEDHLQKLYRLSRVLRFQLTSTPCENLVCENCRSEQAITNRKKERLIVGGPND